MHTCTYCTHLSFFLSQSHMQIISHVKLPYRNVDIKILWLIASLVCFNLSPSPSSCLCGSPLTSGGFFLFGGGGCNNSDREELRSEKQTKCEGDGGGVRCSWGLLWSHVGSFSLRRLRHDSLSAQNGLRHISMSDLCVCLTLRTVVNSAGARRWSAAAAAAECWHTCRAEKKARTHTHTHSHNLDWVSQVQSICIHGRFCIGSTTYSVPSNCGTWLFTFTLRRPWTVLECVYGCIYGSMVLPEWIHLAECIFPLGSSLKILEGVCFDAQIDPPDTPTYAVRVSISRLIHLCPLHNQIPPCTFTRA